MKRAYKGLLYTELGRKIHLNDLLNELKKCLKEYQQHHKIKPKKKK